MKESCTWWNSKIRPFFSVSDWYKYVYVQFCIYSPENLEYGSPAYEKYMKAKRFDPAKSDVMKVLNQHEQNRGDFSVDNGTENDSSSSIGY